MLDPNLPVTNFPGLLDPTQMQAPVPHGHVQTLDQLATDAREAQIRLEALELKIKNAFESKQISEDSMATPGDGDTHLTNEIAQIQKEKKHKQELMNQLQKVEQEIHLKMVQKVKESIDRVEPTSGEIVDDVGRYTDPCNPTFPYAYDPNTTIDDSKCAIQVKTISSVKPLKMKNCYFIDLNGFTPTKRILKNGAHVIFRVCLVITVELKLMER